MNLTLMLVGSAIFASLNLARESSRPWEVNQPLFAAQGMNGLG